MSSTWFIDLERRVEREEFDKVCTEIGIRYAPAAGKNTYYDNRKEDELATQLGVERNPVAELFGIGGVEIIFGGINETQDNTPYATQITVSANLPKERFGAMRRTASDLGQRLPFKSISGEWFDDVSKQPLPYNADVYRKIERQ